jgi:hypothetical protein
MSAQQSRLKKKSEVLLLNQIVQKKDEKFDSLVKKILIKRLKSAPDALSLIL